MVNGQIYPELHSTQGVKSMSISSSGDFIRSVKKRPEDFFIIHYSCQNLFDDNDQLSPRITSIAIQHYSSGQAVSFSTHAVAEELGIGREELIARFDEVEGKLLRDFYAFIRDRRDKFWIHWNMRNLTYGFEHLEHRYRTLGFDDAPVIPVERRINLNDMLGDRYGKDYVDNPKMQCLMELNGGLHREFLTGAQEVTAFQNAEYIRMHASTLCKVGFFSNVIRKLSSGKLKTKSKSFGVFVDRLFESRTAKTIGFFASIVGIVSPVVATIMYVL